eukprot:scaffold31351_cov34-Prasinocladus_malaysianus.AAC.2
MNINFLTPQQIPLSWSGQNIYFFYGWNCLAHSTMAKGLPSAHQVCSEEVHMNAPTVTMQHGAQSAHLAVRHDPGDPILGLSGGCCSLESYEQVDECHVVCDPSS